MISLVAFLLIGSAAAALEEAPYTVLMEHEGWEERMTPPLKWVSSDGYDILPHDGAQGSPSQEAFYRLFNYIDGQNSEGMKIDMTAPVTYRILPGGGEESNYTMSFFIPMSLQENPPMPNNELIFIEDRPEMMVAARRFGGFAGDEEFREETQLFMEMVAQAGVEFKQAPVWTAGYDGPNVIINRRNEVRLEMPMN